MFLSTPRIRHSQVVIGGGVTRGALFVFQSAPRFGGVVPLCSPLVPRWVVGFAFGVQLCY